MTVAQCHQTLKAALALHQSGKLEEAALAYARVMAAQPRNFDAVHLAGTVALQQGRLEEAVSMLGRARRLDTRSAVCAMREAIALNALGRFPQAEASVRASIALNAGLPEAWFHLGSILRNLGQVDPAIAAYEKALVISPHYGEAHERLGALLSAAKGYGAAERHLRRACELQPGKPVAWSNLGVCMIQLGNLTDALRCLDKAIALDPKLDHAHAAKGLALSKCHLRREAIASYAKAIEINPRSFEARSSRLVELHYLGGISREALFEEHRAFGAAAAEAAGPIRPLQVERPDPERRLRVGFLSPDLHRHSVAYFLEPILAHLDRERFEIFLYNDQGHRDDMSACLEKQASKWVDIAGKPDAAVYSLIRGDEIDILIDLAGHTGANRLPLFARRMAPIQATYLGYPNTTGLSAMDYRMVDAITDPPEWAGRFASEKLVHFAQTAWSYSPPAEAPEPYPGPMALGQGPVFGCFNNFAKVNDETLRLWGRLLGQVSGSRLVLKGHGLGNAILQDAARRRFAAAGLPEARVDLLERTKTLGEHLGAYSKVDVALDTFPYHGTTTTCEALWMGVPVVTLAGDHHACRVGASLLSAVGHPEWIAHSEEGYLQKARELACDNLKLRTLRNALRGEVKGSALFDHVGQAQRFGGALQEMWRAACSKSQLAA